MTPLSSLLAKSKVKAKKNILLLILLCGLLLVIALKDNHHLRLFQRYDKQSLESVRSSPAGRLVSPDGGNRTNVMIHARKRSGSSVTGTYFGKNPDFFYFYEPGWIVANHAAGICGEDFEFLEKIRPQLLSFLDGVYSCNFTQHRYFIKDVNDVPLFRNNGNFPFPAGSATIDDLTRFCRSKKHVITKVLRIYNILYAAPVLRKHDVKVIFLVRDPRGLIKSREMFESSSSRFVTEGELQLNDRLRKELVDYCRWLETNYVVLLNGPDWLRNNSMLVRYEDMVNRPTEVVSKLYEFIGIGTDDVIQDIIGRVSGRKPGNAEAWRKGVKYENVREMQELCPERVWKMFGYRLVESDEMLRDDTTTFVENLPDAQIGNFQDVYYNNMKYEN